MSNEARKSRILILALIVLFAAVAAVIVVSILNKPVAPMPIPGEDGEIFTFGIDENGRYLFPPDVYTLMDGPTVTLTHRTAGGYEVWEGIDPDGEKIVLIYTADGKQDYQYLRGSTQAGVGEFLGFDTWPETGEPIMRFYDKWCDGLLAIPASLSADGETLTLSVPAVWRAGYR